MGDRRGLSHFGTINHLIGNIVFFFFERKIRFTGMEGELVPVIRDGEEREGGKRITFPYLLRRILKDFVCRKL